MAADSTAQVWWALLIALILIVIFFGILGLVGGLRIILVGADGRPSTSKATTLAWTVLIGIVFAFVGVQSVMIQRPLFSALIGGQLADEYLILLGGPFLALVAAKGVVSAKVQSGQIQSVPLHGSAQDPSGDTARVAGNGNPSATTPVQSKPPGEDAITAVEPQPVQKGHEGGVFTDDNGDVDLVDTQYLLFNVIALAYVLALFLVAAFDLPGVVVSQDSATLAQQPFQLLPAIPASLFSLTSLGALTYVAGKVTANNKPAIVSVVPAQARPNERVTIRGRNFVPAGAPAADTNRNRGVEVSIGGRVALFPPTTGPLSVSDSAVTVLVPADAVPGSAVDVEVVTAATATAQGRLHISDPTPEIRSTRESALDRGGTLTIYGRSLRPPPPPGVSTATTRVLFGSVAGDVRRTTDTLIEADVPESLPARSPVAISVDTGWGPKSGPITMEVA